MRKSDIFYRFEKRTADIASLQKLRGHVQKKVPFLAEHDIGVFTYIWTNQSLT